MNIFAVSLVTGFLCLFGCDNAAEEPAKERAVIIFDGKYLDSKISMKDLFYYLALYKEVDGFPEMLAHYGYIHGDSQIITMELSISCKEASKALFPALNEIILGQFYSCYDLKVD